MEFNQTISDNTRIFKIKGSISDADVCRLKRTLTEPDGCRGIRLDLSETNSISPDFSRLIDEIEGGHTITSIKLVNPNQFIIDFLKGGTS
jgi:hypothetical protein